MDVTPELIREVAANTATTKALGETVEKMDRKADERFDKIEALVATLAKDQGSRLRVAESHIGRLNLVVFGLGGSLGLLSLGVAAKYLVGV